jgi:pSer/pThr/pTyr-binding forkhead associated (FHA) protein
MALVTFQVVNGLEKGRTFLRLPTPVTIGREEDNHIVLNDERISRFHAKVQEDDGHIILTDLDSTNGTRINGHPVQMRVLQIGDLVLIGRSALLFGSPEELEGRLRVMPTQPDVASNGNVTIASPGSSSAVSVSPQPLVNEAVLDGDAGPLFPDGPPPLPDGMRPAHQAQVSDLLAYFHEQIAHILETSIEESQGQSRSMRTDWKTWQRLVKLEMSLAVYLRKLAEPRE